MAAIGIGVMAPNMEYPSGVRVYDAYNPEARDIYWKYLNDGIFKLGMDAWWMDSTEPDHLDWKPEDMDTKTYLGSFRKVRNAYPLMTVGGLRPSACSDFGQTGVYFNSFGILGAATLWCKCMEW